MFKFYRENSLYNNSVLLNSSSHFNSSFNFNLKPESFAESYIPTNNTEKDKTIENTNKEYIKSNTLDDFKNLRSRFDKVYQKLKKTANTQDNYLNRIASEEKNIRIFNNNSNKTIEDKPNDLKYLNDFKNIDNKFVKELQKPKTELYRITLGNLKEEITKTMEKKEIRSNNEEISVLIFFYSYL